MESQFDIPGLLPAQRNPSILVFPVEQLVGISDSDVVVIPAYSGAIRDCARGATRRKQQLALVADSFPHFYFYCGDESRRYFHGFVCDLRRQSLRPVRPVRAVVYVHQFVQRLASITGQCLRAGLLFSSFIAGLLFVLAEPAAQLLYGSAQAGRLLRFFAPLALMLYMDALTDGMLKGLSEQVATVRYNTITSVLDVLLLFFLLPRWGTAGYLFTFVATHVLNFALSLRRLVLASGCRPGVRAALQTGLCAAAACAGALLLPQAGGWWGLCLLRAAVFAAVYLAFACLSGTAELCLPQSLRPTGGTPANARTDG